MSYDFSHCSPQHTKVAMNIVHRIDDLTRDIALCSTDTCKNILKASLLLESNVLKYYTDPDTYNSIKDYL